MKLFLVKDLPVRSSLISENERKIPPFFVDPLECEDDDSSEYWRHLSTVALHKSSYSKHALPPRLQLNSMSLNVSMSCDNEAFHNGIASMTVSGTFIVKLIQTCGSDVKIKVKFGVNGFDGNETHYLETGGECPIHATENGLYFAHDDHVKLSEYLLDNWHSPSTIFGGSLTIQVRFENHTDQLIMDNCAVFRKMLYDEVETDTEIVPKNGATIKCHRSVLAAHSPELQNMLSTTMKEPSNAKIQMEDLSEDVVRAFLAYLYCWDISEARQRPEVSFELLKAGRKYRIQRLERCMRNVLLETQTEEFSVDVALQLFLYVRDENGGEELKKQAMRALKSKPENLKSSQIFQHLFKDIKNEAVIELCMFALFE